MVCPVSLETCGLPEVSRETCGLPEVTRETCGQIIMFINDIISSDFGQKSHVFNS